MKYQRLKSSANLSKEKKIELMRDYLEFYREQYAKNPATLNCKVPRNAFDDVINTIGSLLLEKTSELVKKSGTISDFLNDNPLPPSMSSFLPPETRAFCLGLNALKQWVAAEQSAMDRFILGGTARKTCRETTSSCLVTGQPLDEKNLELHHPVRDGRPPLPLNKEGHKQIEGQRSSADGNTNREKLKKLKREGNRSWIMLRKGCLDLLDRDVNHTTKNVGASSKVFARKASQATGMDYEQILEWLDQNT